MITQTSPIALRRRRTLRSWLTSVMKSFDHGCAAIDGGGAEPVSPVPIRSDAGTARSPSDERQSPRGNLLPFPLHGEALLLKLADVLRRHVAGRQPDHNPLWLTISRYPRLRLSIDGTASVDYLSEISTYRAVIEADPDVRLIMETTNFDALASFVMQYVNDRLLGRPSMEAAR